MYSYSYYCRFNDCDPAGIMFFGNIFTVIHQCYESWVLENGLGNSVFQNEKLAFPIIHTEADYMQPVRLHDRVQIELAMKHKGESSFVLVYQVLNASGKISIKAETVHVCINKQTGQKTGLPEFMQTILTDY